MKPLTQPTEHPTRRPMLVLSSIVLVALFSQVPGSTAKASPAGYAVVVGSNAGGPGQATLQFAADDAQRVADLLTELGDYAPEHVNLLQDPSAADVLSAIDTLRQNLLAHPQEDTRAFFFYSGHARANALSLGSDELPLGELRRLILELPATVKFVVLDACQSGAFSGIKGSEPAADFSFNSVAQLDTRGTVVLASSSAAELSQESADLRGSYFTHHLVVALRGAGDDDKNAVVTVDEAYRYAYRRTLAATAETAVGRQHVTLETNLLGKGELPLTFLDVANAKLILGRDTQGQMLVLQQPSGTVFAEVEKARGDDYSLALPAGTYSVSVRKEDSLERCLVTLAAEATAELEQASCTSQPLVVTGQKGDADVTPRFALELGVAANVGKSDAYTRRLQAFGFVSELGSIFASSVTLTARVNRYVTLGLTRETLEEATFGRRFKSPDEDDSVFSYSTVAYGGLLRATRPFAGGIITPYAQAAIGLATAKTRLKDPYESHSERFYGNYAHLGFGAVFMPWRHAGLFAGWSYGFAPVIKNLLDETHNSGGHRWGVGVRGAI